MKYHRIIAFAKNHRLPVGAAILIVAAAMSLSGYWLATRGVDSPASASAPSAASALGITYVQLTPQMAAYYDVGVSQGVLVTDVASGSAGARGGLRPGDVITSFAGQQLGPDTPLFGILTQNCPGLVDIEVCRDHCLTREQIDLVRVN